MAAIIDKYPVNPSWPKKDISGSGQIKQLVHDPEGQRLFIMFVDTSVYSYTPVTSKKYLEMAESTSAGSYFHKHIKKLKTEKH